MKKSITAKFGFELAFACTIVAVFILPAIVYGQSTQKRTEIIIENGDTTVNGKKMGDLTAAERKYALGMFNNGALNPEAKGKILKRFSIKPKNDTYASVVPGDSLSNHSFNFKIDTLQGDKRSSYTYTYSGPQDHMPRMKPNMRNYNMPTLKGQRGTAAPADISARYRFTPHNEQNFTFNNVDVNGIATTITFNVADASLNEAKRVNVTKNDLELKDLTLTPEFSTGKTWIMFTLDTKAAATVQLAQSDGKILWSDKCLDGTFRKNFSLPVNGLYLLKVQQGNKVAVKRIVKE